MTRRHRALDVSTKGKIGNRSTGMSLKWESIRPSSEKKCRSITEGTGKTRCPKWHQKLARFLLIKTFQVKGGEGLSASRWAGENENSNDLKKENAAYAETAASQQHVRKTPQKKGSRATEFSPSERSNRCEKNN